MTKFLGIYDEKDYKLVRYRRNNDNIDQHFNIVAISLRQESLPQPSEPVFVYYSHATHKCGLI